LATRIQDIEQRLWRAADELRANSRLSSQEYSLPVLGLIFLRYADHHARHPLDTLKAEKLVLDWRKQQRTRAAVRVTIETLLDENLPPAYETTLYNEKCERVYNHVYEKYYGAGRSVYSLALAA
jgi:type I restriction-modification system DNA methylase subunit